MVSNVGTWQSFKGIIPETADFQKMLDINLISQLSVLRVFSEPMMSKGGAFVLVGASRGIFKGNDLSYNVSKYALEELVRKSAENLRKYNIRVNAVLPGSVGHEDNYYKVFPFNFTKFSEKTQLEPIEVAMVNAFLVSEMSLGINGQCISVDRGLNTV